jgi:SAM-dependent methyltransferase
VTKGGTRQWVVVAALMGVACRGGVQAAAAVAQEFPKADRPVADIVAPSWDSEGARDGGGEAERVLSYLKVGPGTRVGDIGAGSGYYTTRLARRVAPGGKVYAEDIIPKYIDQLRDRLVADDVRGVVLVTGTEADPKLPPASVDLVLMSHMYHEIGSPYELLWRLQPAFLPGGRLAIVDMNRDTARHGTPLALLTCELAAVGYTKPEVHDLSPAAGYLVVFAAPAARPDPASIKACSGPR